MTQQRERVERQVLRRADAWADAERRNDTAALDQILAPAFVGVGPFGFLLTKEQWLTRYRSGDLKTSALALDELSVRQFGDTAILVGRQISEGTYQGRPTGGRFRATLIFVRERDDWRLAGLHYSTIADPPPAGPPR